MSFFLRLSLLTILTIAFSLTGFAQGSATGGSVTEESYEQLLAKVKNGGSADYKALRFAYAKRPDVGNPDAFIKAQAAMLKAYNEKKFKDAIKVAEEIQKTTFVDMNSHVIAAMAYQGLGDAKKAKFHESIYLGLVNSILDGADGNTTKTAYVVISPAEELVLLNALELARGTREIVTEDGSSYSLHTALDKAANQPVKIYFRLVNPPRAAQ